MSAADSIEDHPQGGLLAPAPGDIVRGRYRLVRALGEGGMGLVFEAEHLRLRQSVAIKFLRPEVLAMPDAVARFEREARASARIRGPHVVHVVDVDTDEFGRPYLVLELLRGRDLEAELRVRGALPIGEAVDWVLQACAAVSEAHAAGIVHRDLKPSNLFLAEEFGGRVVKVLDFGISKVEECSEPAVTGMAVTIGTPLYMSPEQVRSSRDVDARTDVWSLGVILYELLAGAPPFSGTTTAAIAAIVADATPGLCAAFPHVPPELERVVMTALAKCPEDRFPTAEALAAALLPFASPEGVNGPYSLRPSQRAFEVASQAMARAPASHRVTCSDELLRLPPAPPEGPRGRPHPRRETVRNFTTTFVIGLALAASVSMTVPSSTRTPGRLRLEEARSTGVPSGAPVFAARSDAAGTEPGGLPDASVSPELTTEQPPAAIVPSAFPAPSCLPVAPARGRRVVDVPQAPVKPLYL